MQLPPKNYDAMVKRANPPRPVVKDCLWAFFVGGAICLLGEALRQFCRDGRRRLAQRHAEEEAGERELARIGGGGVL